MSKYPADVLDVILPQHDGYPPALAAGDTRDVLIDAGGATTTDFPKSWWIEPKQWKEVAEYNTANKLWPVHFLDRHTHQGNSHECTGHCLDKCAESCWNAQRAMSLGPPVADILLSVSAKASSVWFSCIFPYLKVNPRQWGGANTRDMIAAAVEYGFLPDIKQPRSNKFKHSIVGTCGGKDTLNQSNGNWLSFSNLPAGWQSTGDLFKPKEIIFPESYEQIVCCVLNRRGVGVGRSGHSIMYGEYDPDEDAMLYPDSYNLIRVDSRRMINSAVGGAYCIASMTQPDNWNDLAN